jgi:hypothetical protein
MMRKFDVNALRSIRVLGKKGSMYKFVMGGAVAAVATYNFQRAECNDRIDSSQALDSSGPNGGTVGYVSL